METLKKRCERLFKVATEYHRVGKYDERKNLYVCDELATLEDSLWNIIEKEGYNSEAGELHASYIIPVSEMLKEIF